MNTKKRRDKFTFLHEFKRGHNASQTVANLNRVCGEGCTCDQRVRCLLLKFRCEDTSLEDYGGSGHPSTIHKHHLKTITKQNPRQSVKEVCQIMRVSILTISISRKLAK